MNTIYALTVLLTFVDSSLLGGESAVDGVIPVAGSTSDDDDDDDVTLFNMDDVTTVALHTVLHVVTDVLHVTLVAGVVCRHSS